MTDFKVGIIGRGKMGTSLFHYLLDFNLPLVWICRTNNDKLRLKRSFEKKIKRLLNNEIIDREKYMYRLENTWLSNSVVDLSDCNLIIESISEDLKYKQQLFSELDNKINEDCIFASNSSSILPSDWYTGKIRSAKTIGLHFFYPVSMKNIVEVILTNDTYRETLEFVKRFLRFINRRYILLNEESAFLLNRLFLDFQAGAYLILKENQYSVKGLDDLIRKNFFPLGVFEFFDHIGIDVVYKSIKNYTVYSENKSLYQPLLDHMAELVKENKLGIKTSHGFYKYPGENQSKYSQVRGINRKYEESVIRRLRKWYLEAANRFVNKGYCKKNKLNYAVKEYMNCEKGPFEY